MPFPKLSAVLNNCPLHAITPELIVEITKFRDNIGYDNHHNGEYALVKNIFAKFYGFNPEIFTWKQFADILDEYNAFDAQILLGPVLREFMETKLPDPELLAEVASVDNLTPEKWIERRVKINPDTGRYYSLAPDELAGFVAHHLGFSLRATPAVGGEITYLCENHPIALIDIFHQGGEEGAHEGGHWERVKNGVGAIKYQEHEDTQLSFFLHLLDEDIQTTQMGFKLLQSHVQLTSKKISERKLFPEIRDELIFSSQLIGEYVFNTKLVSPPLARRLLGSEIPLLVLDFINDYQIPDHPPVYEEWVRAYLDKKPLPQVLENTRDHLKRLVSRLDLEEEMRKMAEQQQSTEEKPPQTVVENRVTLPATSVVDIIAQPTTNDIKNDTPHTALVETSDIPHTDLLETSDTPHTALVETSDIAPLVTDTSNITSLSVSQESPVKPVQSIVEPKRKSEAESQFENLLKPLQTKIDNLHGRKLKATPGSSNYRRLEEAEEAANNLKIQLEKHAEIYFKDPTPSQNKIFKEGCKSDIAKAKLILDKHRGWSNFLVNLGLSLTLVGMIGRGLYNLSQNRNFFFVHQTDSSSVADKVYDGIEQIKSTGPESSI